MWFGVGAGSAHVSPLITIKMQDTNAIRRITGPFYRNASCQSRIDAGSSIWIATCNRIMIKPMASGLVASVILFAAIATPAPVRITQNDLVGMWVTVRGDCSRGQHLLSEDGKYKKWCFDSISGGEWFLSGGNKIILRHDPKTADAEIITIVGFQRYSDHTVLDVRYQNGSREKWKK